MAASVTVSAAAAAATLRTLHSGCYLTYRMSGNVMQRRLINGGCRDFISRRMITSLSSPSPSYASRCIGNGVRSTTTTFTSSMSTSISNPTRYVRRVNVRRTRVGGEYDVLLYCSSCIIIFIGLGYAAVPLYKIFCQATGIANTPERSTISLSSMVPNRSRTFKVRFNSDVGGNMLWKFKPLQKEVLVVPGETSLAFFHAKNPTDRPIIGISTYSVLPYEAGQYFNKVQCFCFEEQRLNPGEEVDMPVFFYLDPDCLNDPAMYKSNEIILSYTFFESISDGKIHLPDYAKQSKASLD